MEFESIEDAQEALETLNGTEIEGRAVHLEFSYSGKTETLWRFDLGGLWCPGC